MGLEWREQLSVGNDVIDSDHKYLIGIINMAEQSLGIMNRELLMSAINNLSQYSKKHFAAEEKIARAVGFTNVSRLHQSHEALLEKLEQIKLELGKEWSPGSVDHFTALLREWLINHVIKEDLQMKPFLAKHSPMFDPR